VLMELGAELVPDLVSLGGQLPPIELCPVPPVYPGLYPPPPDRPPVDFFLLELVKLAMSHLPCIMPPTRQSVDLVVSQTLRQ
jgi:hypothetical protein